MARTEKVSFVLLIDENGDYAVGKEFEEAKELYEGNIQTLGDCDFRTVNFTLEVPLPKPIQVSAAIPDQPTGQPLTLTVNS